MSWLDGTTDSMDRNLSKLWKIVEDRGAWQASVYKAAKSLTQLSDWRVKVKAAQWCLTRCDPMEPYSPWNSPGQNTGVGSLSLLHGIFPTQGSNPRFPALQADSLPAEPQGKPKNTGMGSLSLLQQIFPTRNWTRVSCIASGFFTNWAMREALEPDRIYEIIIFSF